MRTILFDKRFKFKLNSISFDQNNFFRIPTMIEFRFQTDYAAESSSRKYFMCIIIIFFQSKYLLLIYYENIILYV